MAENYEVAAPAGFVPPAGFGVPTGGGISAGSIKYPEESMWNKWADLTGDVLSSYVRIMKIKTDVDGSQARRDAIEEEGRAKGSRAFFDTLSPELQQAHTYNLYRGAIGAPPVSIAGRAAADMTTHITDEQTQRMEDARGAVQAAEHGIFAAPDYVEMTEQHQEGTTWKAGDREFSIPEDKKKKGSQP
jgi:hypothetical protein